MINQRTADNVGKLILRLSLGLVFLLHGIGQLANGDGGLEGMVLSAGLSGPLAYGVFLGEVLGPVLLLIGWYARIGALLMALSTIFAILPLDLKALIALDWLDEWALGLQGIFLLTTTALALTGPGEYAINER